MFLEPYYHTADGKIHFTRQQGSDFAKNIADDFNPLHDADAKRFCIPGDLLFSLIVMTMGLNQRMAFEFTGMVTADVALQIPDNNSDHFSLIGDNEKTYLSVQRSGERTMDPRIIEGISRRYVEFSGHTFPHILVPLMAEKNVMINPDRPLVIYQDMSIDLSTCDIVNPSLSITKTTLETTGKRGNACLQFCFKSADKIVGEGEKNMVLTGLKPYDAAKVADMIQRYDARKASVKSAT